ncbi:hypothetical protein DL96DRAFT_1621532, partial [Flagelloscypha sp. PMI_526]
MAQSDSSVRRAILPVEILEIIISFHFDDFSTLAACSLASSVLLPACRATRFHTITIHGETRGLPPVCDIFESILQVSPTIAQYVRRVRILNPEDLNDEGKTPIPILSILAQLTNTTHVFCSDIVDLIGIAWIRCPWLLDGISLLPALQSVAVETWFSLKELRAWSCSQKIHKLTIFSPEMSSVESNGTLQATTQLHLSTLRLRDPGEAASFSSSILGQSLDLTNLRHMALGLGSSPSSFGTWLSTLAADCRASLRTVVLDIRSSSNEVLLPFQVVPNLQRLWIVYDEFFPESTDEFADQWSPWLRSLFSGFHFPPLFEVTLFVPPRLGRSNESVVRRFAPVHGNDVNFHFVH